MSRSQQVFICYRQTQNPKIVSTPPHFTKFLLATPSLSTIPTIEYQFWLLTIVEESQQQLKNT